MPSGIVVFGLMTLLVAPGLIHAQVSRGGATGVGRGGGQIRATGQVLSRAHVPGSQRQITIQQLPRPDRRHWTVGAMRAPSFKHGPSFGFGRRHFHHPHRFFPHPHRHFHRPRGIVIIEVPGFFGTAVTTHVVPGSRWVEQPLATSPLADSRVRSPDQLAPFDPTPTEVVERMLVLAGVKRGDLVYDLGSGDGRIAIAAARKYGVKAVGFEVDPGLVKLARENVRKEGVEDLVQIRQQDFTKADLSPATVVTLYLSQHGNAAVKPLLHKQLKPGARVVSYTFDMGDWPPKIVETYRDAAGDSHLLYLWEIPEPPVYSENPSSE